MYIHDILYTYNLDTIYMFFWGLSLLSDNHYSATHHISVQEMVFVLSANEAKTQSPQWRRISEKEKELGTVLTCFVWNV